MGCVFKVKYVDGTMLNQWRKLRIQKDINRVEMICLNQQGEMQFKVLVSCVCHRLHLWLVAPVLTGTHVLVLVSGSRQASSTPQHPAAP